LIVVDKPVGMVVHPATGNPSGTLVNALLFKYKNLKEVGERIRSGLINRIDKDTSGIVFVGKTNRGLWFYSRQFANRYVKKEYIAVVKGDFSKIVDKRNSYKLSTYMDRNPVKRKKFAVVKEGKGRIAITGFKFLGLSKDGNFSLVKAFPETGRTHQIRVHLTYLGYPIVGDVIYGGLGYDRLLLHSHKAKLNLLSGAPLECISKVKDTYKTFLLDNFSKKQIGSIIESKKQNQKD